MDKEKEREFILNGLHKLWVNSSCPFRQELLNVICKIEKKNINCEICLNK